MRSKSSVLRRSGRRRPANYSSSISSPSPSPSPSPTPNHAQAGASSCMEDEGLMVPDTYGDSLANDQPGDQGHDGDTETVVPPAASKGRYVQDESVDGQVLGKSSCLKCGKGEKLLVCSENCCPVAFHERCLNFKTKIDELGRFYCPYCTYKRMLVKSQKLRSQAILAKKNLRHFLDPGKEEGGEKKLEGERAKASGSHACPCGQNDNMNENDKKVDSDGMFQSSGPVNQVHENRTSSDDLSSGSERKQQKSKSVSGPTIGSFQHVESSRGLSKEVSAGNETYEGTASSPVITPHVMAQPLRALSTLTLVKRDAPADQTNVQLNHPQKPMDYPLPNVRRKRLNWKPAEEQMLKEGVQAIQGNINKNLPWRKILQYGRHVFDETRTPSDLKDKWKTMTRSVR